MLKQLDDHLPIKLTLESINVVLHTISIYLLVSTFKRGQKTSQHVYLMNLSATELLRNIVLLVLSGLNIQIRSYSTNFNTLNIFTVSISDIKKILSQLQSSKSEIYDLTDKTGFLGLINQTSMYWVYIFAMFLITADRLMAVVLRHKYSSLCTVYRAKVIVITSWFLLAVVPVSSISAVYFSYPQNTRLEWLQRIGLLMRVGLIYLPAILNFLFILFAITSYLIMFLKFIQTERNISNRPNRSVFQMFRNSKFYVAVLIIASFLILSAIPLAVNFVLTAFEVPVSHVPLWLLICLRLSDTADVIIYTFLYTSVQKFWRMKLRSCWSSSQHKDTRASHDTNEMSGKGTESERLNLTSEPVSAASL